MLIRILCFAMVFALTITPARPADRTEIEQKVAELDRQSLKLLGVSLNALRYLVGASPNSYLQLPHLERSGEINYIRELEAKGYVRMQVVQGLPDGTQSNETFLRVIPVGQGIELQRCVVALAHNPPAPPSR